MPASPALVVFLGGFGHTPAEQLVDQARLHATHDTIDFFLSSSHPRTDGPSGPSRGEAGGGNSPPAELKTIVVTDDPSLGIPHVALDVDRGPYHFGRRLAEVMRTHALTSVIYMGGGSLPLLTSEDFTHIRKRLAVGAAVTNNLFSSDLIAFPVTDAALAIIETVDRDNSLARALHERSDLTVEALPRTLVSQYDIDAPSDVAVLKLAGLGGPHLRQYLASLDIGLSRYRAVLPLFLDQAKQLVVAGRVGSHAWAYLERETACRIRLFAEERGMEADGRADAGIARSLLGYHLEAVGLERFFATLAELGDAAFIDSRVLLAHKRIAASREDRFLSDLGRWQEIREPFLRGFTQAAMEAPVPVLLGGHSLVSGGLMALNEHAWGLRDAGEL